MSRFVATLFRGVLLLVLGMHCQKWVNAAVLYDGSLGSTPNAQGWTYIPDNGTFFTPPASVTMTTTTGGTLLQTLSPNTDRAGFSRTDQTLDRAVGFALSFNVRLDGEAHDTLNRSGFSVIAISNNVDKKGIELSFWPNEIFAKEGDVPTFSHAEGITADTTILRTYQLTIQGNNYTLTGTGLGSPLNGLLRDYTASTFPFYSTANFLFLGDNTTSASADIFLGNVSFQAIPEPGTWVMGTLLLLGLGAVKIRRSRTPT